jgi:hypothetical protein
MKNRILEMDLDENGVLSERTPDAGSESFLDNSLLDRLYPGIKACRIKVCEGMLETFQQAKIAGTMMAFEYQGTAYSVVGASGSAKNGLFYCVEKQYEDAVRKRMDAWPEAALSYFGILTSTLKTMVEEPRCSVLLVPDLQLGTNDCRGWVRQRLFDKLSLPAGRFYQFRLAMDNSLQAKGAFKVMDDATGDHLGADIVLPSSSIKPFPQKMHVPSGGIRLCSRVALGVREISRPLEFASSYTLIEHAPKESLLEEIFPQAVREVRALKQSWTEGRHDALVEKIGGKCFDPDDQHSDEEQRAVEALLLADSTGEISRHPYVHYQLDKMLAKWAFKTLTGGGFTMPAFALADDGYLLYHDGQLFSGADWVPLQQAITTVESQYGLCVRYPIRMAEDLLPMHHLPTSEVAGVLSNTRAIPPELAERIAGEQICLKHVYVLRSETAKRNGGDFDFDTVAVVDSKRFPKFVSWRFNLPERNVVTKIKAKKVHSPWFNRGFAALNARGNRIGTITDLKTRCYAAGRNDLAYLLVGELQKELDSLKHGVRADTKLLNEIRQQVPMCPWLLLKNVQRVSELPLRLEVQPTDRIGVLYNVLRKEIEELFEAPLSISSFRGLLVGNNPTALMYDEASVLYGAYVAIQTKLAERRSAAQTQVLAAKAMLESAAGEEQKKQAERKLNAARAREKEIIERTKKEAGTLARNLYAWAQSKPETERTAWAEALHHISSRGNGKGGVMLYAFPQELVDAVASATGGNRVRVRPPKLGALMRVEQDKFYLEGEEGTKFLFRYNAENRTISV